MNTELLGKKPVQKEIQTTLALDVQYLSRDTSFAEKHYRVGELAGLWGLGRETVRKIVKDEPGVIKIRQGVRRYIPHIASRNQSCAEYIPGC